MNPSSAGAGLGGNGVGGVVARSLSTQGSNSINIDAAALQMADEVEYHKEEEEQQRQLRLMISKALDDDDLSGEEEDDDDEEEEEEPNGTSSANNNMQAPLSANGIWSQQPVTPANPQPAWLGPHPNAAPLESHLPPTSTPYAYNTGQQPPNFYMDCSQRGEVEGGSDESEEEGEEYEEREEHHEGGEESQEGEETEEEESQDEDEGRGFSEYLEATNQGQGHNYGAYPQNHQMQQQPQFMQQQQPHQQQPQDHDYEYYSNFMRQRVPQPYQYNGERDNNVADGGEVLSPRLEPAPQPYPMGPPQPTATYPQQQIQQTPAEYGGVNPSVAAADFKVPYRGPAAGGNTNPLSSSAPGSDGDNHGSAAPLMHGSSPPAPARPSTPGSEETHRQKEFLMAESGVHQLEILNKQRAKQIDTLTHELYMVREDSERDIRILKHQLDVAKGERDGFQNSLDQNKHLLVESKQRESVLQGKITSMEAQIRALEASKDELVQKLSSAQTSIECLDGQLRELESSESLSRARQNHESMIAKLQARHQKEVHMLNEKLDSMKHENSDKEEKNETLRKQLDAKTKECEEVRIERADSINRLNRQLEESQLQVQDYLEAGTGKEAAKLKGEIQNLIASKSITEDINQSLQKENFDLREQLVMYESTITYGLNGTGTSQLQQTPDDSYAQLAIKKQTTTMDSPALHYPSPFATPSTKSPEQMVSGLKQELERCLGMYKSKREQLLAAEEKLKTLKSELETATTRAESMQDELKSTKSQLAEFKGAAELGASSLEEAKLRRELDTLRKEKALHTEELEEIKLRLNEIAESEERTSELNQDLSKQMANMVRESDDDKRLALQKCEEACMALHEASLRRREAELSEAHKEELRAHTEELKQKVEESRRQVEELRGELSDVKEAYVEVCREKDTLEESLRARYEASTEKQIIQLKADLAKEKEADLEEIKQSLKTDSHLSLVAQREKWQAEQEEETKRKIEGEVAMAKVQWFEDHQQAKEKAVQQAVEAKEHHLNAMYDNKLKEELQTTLEQAKKTWQAEKRLSFETELQQRIKRTRESWDKTELPQRLDAVKEDWEKTMQEKDKEASLQLNAALSKAKEAFEKQQSSALREVEEKHKEALHKIQQTHETTLQELQQAKIELGSQLEEIKTTLTEKKAELETLKNQLEEKEKELGALRDVAQSTEKGQSQEEQKKEIEEAVKKAQEECKKQEEEAVRVAVEQARISLASEKHSRVLKEIDNVSAQVQEDQEMHRKLLELNQSVRQLEQERGRLEQELSVQDGRFQREQAAAVRAAVQAVQEQCDADYKTFLREHQFTLNKALTAAREQYARDKTELIQKYELDLHKAKSHESESTEFTKEKSLLEEMWRNKLESAEARHQHEKEALMKEHRQNLSTALEEARNTAHWNQQLGGESADEAAAAWREERSHLLAEIENRDALISAADEHMEAEVVRLHDQMAKQHSRLLNEEVNVQTAKLEKEYEGEIERLSEEKSSVMTKLEQTRGLLQELEAKYRKDTANLTEKVKQVKQEVNKLRQEVDEKTSALTAMENDKLHVENDLSELSERLTAAEKQHGEMQRKHDKAERQRQEAVEAYRRAESEHGQTVNAHKQRQHELNTKLQQLERQLADHDSRDAERRRQLDQEHAAAMDQMKSRMVEIRTKHKAALEHCKKEHDTERANWKKQFIVLQKQQQQMQQQQQQQQQSAAVAADGSHAPMHTDNEMQEALVEMREHYLTAIDKMKEDITIHIRTCNEEAAVKVREEVLKERHNVAKRLRKYYLKCLTQMLLKDFDRDVVAEKIEELQQQFDEIPQKDSSSCCSSSNNASTVTTPTIFPAAMSRGGGAVAGGGSVVSGVSTTVGGVMYSSHSASSSQEPDKWSGVRTPSTTTDYGYCSRSEPRSYNTGSRISVAPVTQASGGSAGSGVGGGNARDDVVYSSSSCSPLTPTATATINTSDDEFFVTAGGNGSSNKPTYLRNNFYNLEATERAWRSHEVPADTEGNRFKKQQVAAAKSDDDILKASSSSVRSQDSSSKGSGANKRTSFGSVTEYLGGNSVSNYKVPSEPVLTSSSSTWSAITPSSNSDPFDRSPPGGAAGAVSSVTTRQRPNYLACKSIESFSLVGTENKGSSGSSTRATPQYRYTPLRTALASASAEIISAPANPTLKSKSEADLNFPGRFASVAELPEDVFGHLPEQAPLFNPPAERESDIGGGVGHQHSGKMSNVTVRSSRTSSSSQNLLSVAGLGLGAQQNTLLSEMMSPKRRAGEGAAAAASATTTTATTLPLPQGTSTQQHHYQPQQQPQPQQRGFRPVNSPTKSSRQPPLSPVRKQTTPQQLSTELEADSPVLRPIPMKARTTHVPSTSGLYSKTAKPDSGKRDSTR